MAEIVKVSKAEYEALLAKANRGSRKETVFKSAPGFKGRAMAILEDEGNARPIRMSVTKWKRIAAAMKVIRASGVLEGNGAAEADEDEDD